MKNLSMLLMLMTLSTPLLAQTKTSTAKATAESGSGNGNLNRDILAYDAKLEEATEELKSLEESFAKLIEDLRAISAAKVPEFASAGSEFWDSLGPNDQQKIMNLDKKLTGVVETQIQQLSVIKQQVLDEQATINALAKELPRYKERGMARDLKRDIKYKRYWLKDSLEKKMAALLYSLEEPITGGSYYEKNPYLDMKQCASALCIDIMTNRFTTFSKLVNNAADIKISMLGMNRKLGFIAHEGIEFFPITYSRYGEVKRNMRNVIKNSSYDALQETNEAAIRNINN